MAKASKPSTKHAPRNTQGHLIIEVHQNGVLQTNLSMPPAKKRRIITFGSKRSCDLWIEHGRVPEALGTFFVENNGFGVLLEPRFSGMVNTGAEFATVADLLRPQGALTALGTISDPLKVKLEKGSRGMLRLGDFDILFKVDRPKPPERQLYLMEGAKGGAFSGIAEDSQPERWSGILALFFAAIMFVPLTVWLTTVPSDKPRQLSDLPLDTLVMFVHPEHYRYLPKIYGKAFEPHQAVAQAIHWVEELQARWDAEDRGQVHVSKIPILAGFRRDSELPQTVQSWRETVAKRHSELEAQRTSPRSERFYSFQRRYPLFVAKTSGETLGSLYVRQLNRVDNINAAYRSLKSLIMSEQGFLTAHYTERGFKRAARFLSPEPESGSDKNFEPDVAHTLEHERYSLAEGWAAAASSSPYFLHAKFRSAPATESASAGMQTPLLVKTGLVAPAFLPEGVVGRASPEAEHNLVMNARYALGLLEVPPPAPTSATIDRSELEAVLIDRREEVRGCYEDALRHATATEGTLRVAWWIGLSGRARDVKVTRSDLDQGDARHLATCLENLILTWNFPRPRHAAIRVEYPFRFVIEK